MPSNKRFPPPNDQAASCHTFRHSFATHLLASGYDIRTVPELLGRKEVATFSKSMGGSFESLSFTKSRPETGDVCEEMA